MENQTEKAQDHSLVLNLDNYKKIDEILSGDRVYSHSVIIDVRLLELGRADCKGLLRKILSSKNVAATHLVIQYQPHKNIFSDRILEAIDTQVTSFELRDYELDQFSACWYVKLCSGTQIKELTLTRCTSILNGYPVLARRTGWNTEIKLYDCEDELTRQHLALMKAEGIPVTRQYENNSELLESYKNFKGRYNLNTLDAQLHRLGLLDYPVNHSALISQVSHQPAVSWCVATIQPGNPPTVISCTRVPRRPSSP